MKLSVIFCFFNILDLLLIFDMHDTLVRKMLTCSSFGVNIFAEHSSIDKKN